MAPPGDPAAGSTRLVRATVAGGCAASLAVAAHVAAGGTPPPVALVVVATALLIRVAHGLAARRRALPTVLGALACSQLAAHVAFTLVGHHGGPGHHHTLAPAELFVEGGAGSWSRAALMTAAHVLAAATTGLLLHRADQALWAAAALRSALPAAAARILGPLRQATVRLRRLLTLAATGSASPAARVGAISPASVPLARPRGLPVGRSARRRGPPDGARARARALTAPHPLVRAGLGTVC